MSEPQCACRFGRLCAFHSKYPGDPKPKKSRVGYLGTAIDGGDSDTLGDRGDTPAPTRKPEVCACKESLALREELASAAAHIVTLLDTFVGADDQQPARRWLAGLEARLP